MMLNVAGYLTLPFNIRCCNGSRARTRIITAVRRKLSPISSIRSWDRSCPCTAIWPNCASRKLPVPGSGSLLAKKQLKNDRCRCNGRETRHPKASVRKSSPTG